MNPPSLPGGLVVTAESDATAQAPNYLGKRKRAIPLKTWETQGDVGCFDEGRDAVAYLKPHVLHRACGNNGGHLADAGLHDDLAQHFVRDNLLHGAGYFVANRLLHKVHPSSSAIDCATRTYLSNTHQRTPDERRNLDRDCQQRRPGPGR